MIRDGRAWVIGVGLLAAACGGSRENAALASPTPIATRPIPPGLIPGYDESWRLTTAVKETSGANCIQVPAVGASASGRMVAARSESTVKFMFLAPGLPVDDGEYVGMLSGDAFTAARYPLTVRFPSCEGEGSYQGSVTGRFSSDGRHLDAIETWSYHFASGDWQITFTWSADRD